MGWLIGFLIAIAIIYFMVISPGFRYSVLGILIIGGGLLALLIQREAQESEVRAQRRAARERATLSAIKPDEISLGALELKKDFSGWTLKGTVVNNSKYTLESIAFQVTISNCSAPQTCIIVGQASGTAYSIVPPNQMRLFGTSSLDFRNMPIVAKPTWTYEIKAIRAAL